MRRALATLLLALAPCAAQPRNAAADLPPAGRSLFDHLVTVSRDGKSVQQIPYPFSALLRSIERHAGTDALGHPGVAAVLIPLGRSLQRNASAGDYFAHPRVVVAVTGEARDTPSRLMLKDRLFLGFQDEAGVIEVISYNEQAGRFEFQVVTDYRAGATPRVAYARRAVCSACHHAAAPIFSRPGWDETNANPAVARALSAHGASFHGVAVKRGVDVPNAIDDSVARANRLALAQALWSRGCEAVTAPADPVSCRAALLLGALERRLQRPGSPPPPAAPDSRLDALRSAWRSLWPSGLPVPDPNIPNRDPFFGRAQELAAPRTLPWGAEEVVPALDPMTPRAAIGTWQADAAGMEALLHTLGSFFAAADVRAIEAALARTEQKPLGPSRNARSGRAAQGNGTVSPTTRDGEDTLARAIDAVADETRAGRSDALAAGALRRAAVLRALSPHLAPKLAPGCCDAETDSMAPALAESDEAARPAAIPAALQPFYTHCSACHDMPAASPPGFLHGGIEAVQRSIARCAPRIRYRLSMWQVPAAKRAKTPMPPPVFVPAWEHAAPRADIERMLDYVSRAAPDPGARAPSYEALPQCRAHATQGAPAG